MYAFDVDGQVFPEAESPHIPHPAGIRTHACVLRRFSCVRLLGTLCTVALQAPLSMGFSRQQYQSGLPFPSPGDLPNTGGRAWISCICWFGSQTFYQGSLYTQVSHIAGGFFIQLNHKRSSSILQWVAYPFSSGSSWPRNWTRVSCIAGGFFTNWAIREALKQIARHQGSKNTRLNLSFNILTKRAPPEKGMANHFSILALRTPWTVRKGKKIGHWKMNSPGW